MNYIRKIKKNNHYQSYHISHCLYGLDADLIMLGLISHEKNFTLLREKLSWKSTNQQTSIDTGFNLNKNPASDSFHLLEISLLKDMLYLEFKPKHKLQVEYSVKKVVDDFIFICMLVGNDFLPKLPHIDIASGGLNLLVRSYKEIQCVMRGFLVNKYEIHANRVELFFKKISSEAEKMFFLKKKISDSISSANSINKHKKNYYIQKFSFDIDTSKGLQHLDKLKKNYLHGLQWCLCYYHNGCPSWEWFYPEYYSPLASDLTGLNKITISFTKGRPFEPLIQLLAVLPPKSSRFLPACFEKLMVEEHSTVKEFYPFDYKIDLEYKQKIWEGVVLLPFIDQPLLLNTIKNQKMRDKLSIDEKNRNCFGRDIIYYKISE